MNTTMTIIAKMTDDQYELLKNDLADYLAEPLCQLIDMEDEMTMDEFRSSMKDLVEEIYAVLFKLWTNPTSKVRCFSEDWTRRFNAALYDVTEQLRYDKEECEAE